MTLFELGKTEYLCAGCGGTLWVASQPKRDVQLSVP